MKKNNFNLDKFKNGVGDLDNTSENSQNNKPTSNFDSSSEKYQKIKPKTKEDEFTSLLDKSKFLKTLKKEYDEKKKTTKLQSVLYGDNAGRIQVVHEMLKGTPYSLPKSDILNIIVEDFFEKHGKEIQELFLKSIKNKTSFFS